MTTVYLIEWLTTHGKPYRRRVFFGETYLSRGAAQKEADRSGRDGRWKYRVVKAQIED